MKYFSIDGDGRWAAQAFGKPWNGFCTPHVTREVALDVLKDAVESGDYALDVDGDTLLVTDMITYRDMEYPQEPVEIPVTADGLYDLGVLGWVFTEEEEEPQPIHTLRIEVGVTNAAFEDGRDIEVARILRQLADRLEEGGVLGRTRVMLRDFNGNTVGTAQYY